MEEDIYYIHINGEQRGPFEKDLLLAEGMAPDTMVWRPGLEEWVEATKLPELSHLFNVAPPPRPQGMPYGQPSGGYNAVPPNSYNRYNDNRYNVNQRMPGTYPPGWTNWLGWAIAATVLGVFCYIIMAIPGIIGIVKANEANSLARMGDPRAYTVNSTAKAWTLVGLIINGLILLFVILMIIIFGVALFGLGVAANGY